MKRMFDKEEIVEIAKEGSVVDSELSETSENPVQNKVITEALGEVLPDTTGQTDKFLKVGSDGLEWAEAGGEVHLFNVLIAFTGSSDMYIAFPVLSNSSTPPTLQQIAKLLKDAGYTGGLSSYRVQGDAVEIVNNNLTRKQIYNIYSSNGTNIYATLSTFTYTGVLNGSSIEFSKTESSSTLNAGYILAIESYIIQ